MENPYCIRNVLDGREEEYGRGQHAHCTSSLPWEVQQMTTRHMICKLMAAFGFALLLAQPGPAQARGRVMTETHFFPGTGHYTVEEQHYSFCAPIYSETFYPFVVQERFYSPDGSVVVHNKSRHWLPGRAYHRGRPMYRECFCTADPLYADMELDDCCYGPHADRCFRPNPQYYGPRWHQFPRLHKHYPGEYRQIGRASCRERV